MLLAILHTCSSQSRDVYEYEKSKWNTDKPSPNVKMKLSIGGMNHVRRAALNVINDVIPNLSGFKATVKRADGASITIEKGRVSSYVAPKFSQLIPKPPNQLVLGIEQFDVG
jgi:hypothetical protein